ncbi:MAG: type VI secretion system tip protein VgrG [Telmatospirillum sp.]|nr:type VI secretion system tip protein VgrG [Telmatospirillum sp.]
MDGFGITQDDRILAITSPLGDDRLLLERLDGIEGLSMLFDFTATVRSLDDDLDPASLLAQNVTIRLKLQEGRYRMFNGIVAALDGGHAAARGQRHYQLQIVPWLWSLTRTSDCRIFQNKSTLDILSTILGEFGYRDVDMSKAGPAPVRSYCVQYRETDFQFISRLLEEDGISYFFRHAQGRHTLVLGSQTAAYETGDEPRVLFSAGSQHSNHLDEWHRRHAYRASAWTVKDYNFETSRLPLEQRSPTLSDYRQHPLHEHFDYPGLHDDAGGGERRAKLAMQAEEVERVTVQAAGDCRSLAPGRRFRLSGHPVAAENGDYVVTSGAHHATDLSYESGGKSETGYRNSLTCIPAATPFVPARVTPRPVIAGLQTAVVVGPAGQEIYCDSFGRVKVQFFWDRLGGGDEQSSCWMRVAQPWAGRGFGGQVIPRVGMEVVVAFLEGNPDRPLVVGSVPNAETSPPLHLPDEQTRTSFRSASSPGGGGFNLFTMEDKAGAEEIAFHSQKDMSMVVRNNLFKQVGQNMVVTSGQLLVLQVGNSLIQITDQSIQIVSNGSSIVLDKNGISQNGQTIWLNP